MLTCRGFHDLVGDFVEGALSPARRREAAEHLLSCRDCARSRRIYEKTVALARAAYSTPGPEKAPALPADLVGKILAAARPKRAPSAAWGLVQLISGIAASQLIVFYLGH